jgi:hypothetical protein
VPSRCGTRRRAPPNGGLAFEHSLSDDVSVYAAFHTDFSASVGGTNVTVSDWDLYLLGGGASFRIGGNRFTLARTR